MVKQRKALIVLIFRQSNLYIAKVIAKPLDLTLYDESQILTESVMDTPSASPKLRSWPAVSCAKLRAWVHGFCTDPAPACYLSRFY